MGQKCMLFTVSEVWVSWIRTEKGIVERTTVILVLLASVFTLLLILVGFVVLYVCTGNVYGLFTLQIYNSSII